MKRLVDVPLEDGSSILIEIKEPDGGIERAAAPSEIEKSTKTLESALESVRPTATAIVKKIRDMPHAPDEISIEFGIGLKMDCSGVLKIFVSAETNANFKVGFTWKKQN